MVIADFDQTLEELYEDLWVRWETLCDNLPELEFPNEDEANIVYSRNSTHTYNLRDFSSGAFSVRYKPTKTLDKASPNRYQGYTYLLNNDGLPIMSQYGYVDRPPLTIGKYEYNEDEVLYYEIYRELRIPKHLVRIVLDNGEIAHYQYFYTWVGENYRIPKQTGLKLRQRIREDMVSREVRIHKFDRDEKGRKSRCKTLSELQVWRREYYTLNYTYDAEGNVSEDFNPRKPDRVIRFDKPGAKKKEDPVLSALAAKIADKVIDTLKAQVYSNPLQLVMLSYSAVENYIPGVTAATLSDPIPNLMLLLGTLSPDRCILLDEKDFKPEYKKLMRKMEAADDFSEGTKMLRLAAKSITERAPKELNTTPQFIAFAVDWEEDAGDIEGLLLECGGDQAKVDFFKEKGWI